eukprot:TRINITY_DN91631_c0_g1_i1.p1 TRINITY_DN91631_c0_g1~~TRINITY_DN91631_c0_g1_i1.p1  ORF type:complete len:321 (-),score=12.97 TRINITY_DN91631_c0_g1_i1:249-1136(-)
MAPSHGLCKTPLMPTYVGRMQVLGTSIAVGAVSSSVAGCITNPIDVVKTEMQVATRRSTGSMFLTLQSRVAQKGFLSLWAGVPAMMLRSCFYAGIRLGTYEPIKQVLGARGEASSMWQKILAGTLSGSIGAAAANPVEVVKTRMQADPLRYNSMVSAFTTMLRKEGLASFSKGLLPHMLRGAAVTSSQIGIYDDAKHRLMNHTNLREGLLLRFIASMVAGLVTTTVSSPFDVVKTRAMTQVGGSVVSASVVLWEEAGPRAFFKGWTANYARLGPHTVIVFLVYEQVRLWAGIGAI